MFLRVHRYHQALVSLEKKDRKLLENTFYTCTQYYMQTQTPESTSTIMVHYKEKKERKEDRKIH